MRNEKKSLPQRLIEDWPAKALSVAAALVLFLFNRMSSLKQDEFVVPLVLAGSERFMPLGEEERTVRVIFRCEESDLKRVRKEDLQAYVDLSETVEEGSFSFPVRIRKIGQALQIDPLEISVEPMELRLDLESAATAVVPIRPRFRGSPAAGYERVDYQISPPSAEIRGPRSVIAGIKEVSTEGVDMTGIKADFDAETLLEEPSPSTVLSNTGAVRIAVTVRQAVAVKTFEALKIETKGLKPWLELASTLPEGVLKLQGSQEALKGFQPGEGTLVIDLSGIDGPGLKTLPVVVEANGEFQVVSVEPETVEVVTRAKD